MNYCWTNHLCVVRAWGYPYAGLPIARLWVPLTLYHFTHIKFNTLTQCQTRKGTMMNIVKKIALPILWSLKTASYRAQGLCTRLEMDFLSAIDRIDRSYADKRWVAKWKTAPEKEPF